MDILRHGHCECSGYEKGIECGGGGEGRGIFGDNVEIQKPTDGRVVEVLSASEAGVGAEDNVVAVGTAWQRMVCVDHGEHRGAGVAEGVEEAGRRRENRGLEEDGLVGRYVPASEDTQLSDCRWLMIFPV